MIFLCGSEIQIILGANMSVDMSSFEENSEILKATERSKLLAEQLKLKLLDVISFLHRLRHNSEPTPGFSWRILAALQRVLDRPLSETFEIVLKIPFKSRKAHQRRKQWDKTETRGCKYILASHEAHFLLSVSDKVISPKLFVAGQADFPKFRSALRLLNLDQVDCLVDVGANVGEISVLALTKQYAKRVIAIEPDDENFRLLEINALLNHLSAEQILTYCAAAGSGNPRELALVRSSTNFGDHQITPFGSDRFAQHSEIRWVNNLRLDDIIELSATETALLFIDVQGYELQVLQGASALISRKIPLVMEISPSHLERHGSLDELMFVLRDYRGYYDLGLHRPTMQRLPSLEQRYLRLRHLDRHTDILVV
jgi:FkbM family methyltransferase